MLGSWLNCLEQKMISKEKVPSIFNVNLCDEGAFLRKRIPEDEVNLCTLMATFDEE